MKGRPLVIFVFIPVLLFWSMFFISHSELLAASDTTVDATAKISVCGNNAKEGSEHCDNNDFGGKTCADLGFDGGTLLCSSSCEYATTSCTTNATVTSAPTFTATTGGDYTLVDTSSDNSAKVTVPENFYTQDLKLEMFSYEESVVEPSKPAPSGKNFVGNAYDFVFVNPDGDAVSAISQPATLVLAYTDADISGLDESTLAPYRWGSGDSSWQLIPSSTIDTVNNKVTFSTKNFSSFALFGSPPTPTPTPTPTTQSGGGGGGGWIFYSPTPTPVVNKINFSGKTEPQSRIEVWEGGQIITATIANADGSFNVNVSGFSSGNHTLNLYSETNKGKRISTSTFQLNLSAGHIINIGNLSLFSAGRQAGEAPKTVSAGQGKTSYKKTQMTSLPSAQLSEISASVRKSCGLSCRTVSIYTGFVSKLKVALVGIFKKIQGLPSFIIKDGGWW